jgi:hypothetical protein
MTSSLEHVRERVERQAFTVPEFCARNRISLSLYRKLQKQGRGPRLMGVSSRQARISIEAEREWRQPMEQYTTSDTAALARQRMVEMNTRASKLAVKAPGHPGNRKRKKRAS